MPASADLRLRAKQDFLRYYLDLCSPSIAEPSSVHESLGRYLSSRREEVGDEAFRLELEQEMVELAGEIEQDLRQRYKERALDCLAREPLLARFQECLAAALKRAGRAAGS